MHIPNVVRFQLTAGGRLWHIVECYLAPHDAYTLERVVVAIKKCPWGAELLISRDFNAYLVAPDRQEHGKNI